MMNCPICGNPVIGVYHEWNGDEDTAKFEYFHAEVDGVRHEVCVIVLGYEEGIKRHEHEWLEMSPTHGIH